MASRNLCENFLPVSRRDCKWRRGGLTSRPEDRADNASDHSGRLAVPVDETMAESEAAYPKIPYLTGPADQTRSDDKLAAKVADSARFIITGDDVTLPCAINSLFRKRKQSEAFLLVI